MQVLTEMVLAVALLAVLWFILSWYSRERPAVHRARARVLNLADERRKRDVARLQRNDRLRRR